MSGGYSRDSTRSIVNQADPDDPSCIDTSSQRAQAGSDDSGQAHRYGKTQTDVDVATCK